MKDEKLKIWEVVKAIEEDKENWAQRYGEAKATMIVNFGPDAKTYKNIVNVDDNLSFMITKAFQFLHDKKTEFRDSLEAIANYATKNGSISITQLRDITTSILRTDTNQKA